MSFGVRPRNSTGVPSDVCVLDRSGTTISRISESRTPEPPSTDRRSSILPGAASKTTREACPGTPPVPAEDEAPGAADATAISGTRPRKTGEPLGPTAISDTRAGCSPGPSGRSAADRGIGSQTNVTRVLPFSPREVPTQVLMIRARVEDDATFASAAVTAGGGAGLGGASALEVCSALSAQ